MMHSLSEISLTILSFLPDTLAERILIFVHVRNEDEQNLSHTHKCPGVLQWNSSFQLHPLGKWPTKEE